MEKNNTMELNLACVIVTYNRLNYLKKALDCYDQQTKMPNYLIIVDNHSTDGTSDYLDGWKKRDMDLNVLFCTCQKILVGAVAFIVVAKRP